MTLDPKEITHQKLHAYLLGAIVPRPIAFASTIDEKGRVNLSPFSFFNCFGSNPPTLVFSPSRRGRDNTTKHTYENVLLVPEVVINVVTYAMVEQTSLASCEFPSGVNEFTKAGFTEVPSVKVKPPRVGESPVAMECLVREVKPMGAEGGAGNLVICEVVMMHIKDEVLGASGGIDPFKLDAVARMGGDFYLRANGENIFMVPKPNDKLGIGFDQLPEAIRRSKVLTGNDLGRLANVEVMPVRADTHDSSIAAAKSQGEMALHQLAQQYLREGKLLQAWQVLLY